MTEETNNAEVRAAIVAQFALKWPQEEAERRVALLEELVKEVPEYAKLHHQRVDIKVHPEHLEFYISQLQKKVRAIIEFTSPTVIDKIVNDSKTTDERLAKVIRLINMMDERAAAAKAAETEQDPD